MITKQDIKAGSLTNALVGERLKIAMTLAKGSDAVPSRFGSDCLLWRSPLDAKEHGRVKISCVDKDIDEEVDVWVATHRLAYLLSGTIPPGARVMHTCGHPSCINPKHMYLDR